jgi:hypothetical protein
MDISWLLKSLCTKDEFYIFLISLTAAWSCDYFKIVEIPWLLMLLYVFLCLSLLRFFWKYGQARIKKASAKAKERKEKQEEKEREQGEYAALIDTHIIGMDIMHKFDALIAISKFPSVPNRPYEIMVKNSNFCSLINYTDSFNNPFFIYENGGYIPLLIVKKQNDYCTLKFNAQFYNLIKSHSVEIVNEFRKKYPTQYVQIIGK